ncbi:hypothetical protein TNIN_185661 [Trichonephila inaurata madagascariensis]|uniref:Uncharacterized protein n=1 Tax=Trichonephila inaurata madagascariensis TaxID=2747483 RepID=A0A8X7CK22_9ARAC|nr:hypothetical protein TNIN_185661 [Trichonephila inaurata madagascariensis]
MGNHERKGNYKINNCRLLEKHLRPWKSGVKRNTNFETGWGPVPSPLFPRGHFPTPKGSKILRENLTLLEERIENLERGISNWRAFEGLSCGTCRHTTKIN